LQARLSGGDAPQGGYDFRRAGLSAFDFGTSLAPVRLAKDCDSGVDRAPTTSGSLIDFANVHQN